MRHGGAALHRAMDRRASQVECRALALRVSRKVRQGHLMRPGWAERRDAFLSRVGASPTVMGILNVTPDSFSDGGQFAGRDAAVAHAVRLAAAGCDIVDVGG